jgi:hypothetical protein
MANPRTSYALDGDGFRQSGAGASRDSMSQRRPDLKKKLVVVCIFYRRRYLVLSRDASTPSTCVASVANSSFNQGRRWRMRENVFVDWIRRESVS